MNKIFFIGFNKTGTTTYNKIVGQQFKSTHNLKAGQVRAEHYLMQNYLMLLKITLVIQMEKCAISKDWTNYFLIQNLY